MPWAVVNLSEWDQTPAEPLCIVRVFEICAAYDGRDLITQGPTQGSVSEKVEKYSIKMIMQMSFLRQ